MKKHNKTFQILALIGAILILLLLTSCIRVDAEVSSKKVDETYKQNSGIPVARVDDITIFKFEVDGHEYLFTYRAHPVHHEGCPCKKK